MKKILVLSIGVFLLTGCGSVEGEEYKCTVDGKEAVFTLNNGMIKAYTLDGQKVSRGDIDEINGLYLTSATTNEEGKQLLNNYVIEHNGSCE